MGGSKKIGSVFIEYSMRTGKVISGQEEVTKKVRAAARQMKTDTREAQGALALLGEEFGVHLPRHVRSFVASLPGADMLAKLLPSAAIAGLGLAFVEAGKKAFEWVQKQGEMGKVVAEGFERMHEAAQLSNDELTVTNDKLDEQIAKLTGKHANNLKLEIDELAVSAGKLYKNLLDDNKAVTDLVEKNQVDLFSQFMGLAGSGSIKDQINTLNAANEAAQRLQGDHVREAQTQIHALGNSKDDEAKKQQIRHDAQIQWDKDEIAKNDALKKSAKEMTDTWNRLHAIQPIAGRVSGADQTRNLTVAGGAAQHFLDQLDRSSGDQLNLDLTATLKSAEAKKEAQKNAAHDAAEAKREADRERGIMLSEMLQDDTLQAESKAKVDAAMEEAAREYFKAEDEGIKKVREEHVQAAAEYHKDVADKIAGMKTLREAAQESYQEFSQTTALRVQEGEESEAQRIAELRKAAAESYQIQAKLLEDQMELEGNWTKEYQATLQERQKLDAEYFKEQSALSREANNIGMRGVVNDVIKRSQDMAGQMKQEMEAVIASTNDVLGNLMTGQYHHGDVKRAGQQLASSAAKTGLQDAEGYLLKATGLGKKKLMEAGNPGHVIVDNLGSMGGTSGVAGAVPPALTGLGGLGVSSGTGFWANVMSMFIPHAQGGNVDRNQAYLVGEDGPEIFTGSSGRIDKLQTAMHANSSTAAASTPSGGDTHFNIDARGATDPAAVHVAIQRAIAEAAPKIATMTAMGIRDARARKPGSSS